MTPEMKTKLEALAKRECWFKDNEGEEDFSIADAADGSTEEAYYGGLDDGATDLARELLAMLAFAEQR